MRRIGSTIVLVIVTWLASSVTSVVLCKHYLSAVQAASDQAVVKARRFEIIAPSGEKRGSFGFEDVLGTYSSQPSLVLKGTSHLDAVRLWIGEGDHGALAFQDDGLDGKVMVGHFYPCDDGSDCHAWGMRVLNVKGSEMDFGSDQTGRAFASKAAPASR